MFRRLVASLTLFAFLAGQLAMIPHAHAALTGSEHREHDARPHFHLSGQGDGHYHEHADPRQSEDRSHRAKIDGPVIDHDATAIYLPDGNSTAASGKRGSADSLNASIDLPADARLLPAQEGLAAPFHPPNAARPVGKLFLTLRTLRI